MDLPMKKEGTDRSQPVVKRCITYGTFDMFHEGHRRLLERARALGSYLIVAVVTDSFNAARGKYNMRQNVVERINAVRDSGLADEIILEEYDGKINDVQKHNIDVLVVGTDWAGPPEYVRCLKRYCEVVYLDRTVQESTGTEISSTVLRGCVKLGVIGAGCFTEDFLRGATATGGAAVVAIFDEERTLAKEFAERYSLMVSETVEALFDIVDAVFINTDLHRHFAYAKKALLTGKNVLVASPPWYPKEASSELYNLALERKLVLLEAMPTAFIPIFERFVAVAQNGKIGRISYVSVNFSEAATSDTECTTSRDQDDSLFRLARLPLLAITRILGKTPVRSIACKTIKDHSTDKDTIAHMTLSFEDALATATISRGVMVKEDLIVAGTEGALYVAAPWWQADSFEVRLNEPNFEDAKRRQTFHAPSRGGGYRYDLAEFVTMIQAGRLISHRLSPTDATTVFDYVGRVASLRESCTSELPFLSFNA